jgi:predicted RNase H-like nuclease (RuvC/YqgF family)
MSADAGASLEALRAALAALTRRLETLDAWIERHELAHERAGAHVEDELDRLRRELRDREQDVWRLEDELRRRGGR